VAWTAFGQPGSDGFFIELVAYPAEQIVVGQDRASDVTRGADGLFTVDHRNIPAGSELEVKASGGGTAFCNPNADYGCVGWTVRVFE